MASLTLKTTSVALNDNVETSKLAYAIAVLQQQVYQAHKDFEVAESNESDNEDELRSV